MLVQWQLLKPFDDSVPQKQGQVSLDVTIATLPLRRMSHSCVSSRRVYTTQRYLYTRLSSPTAICPQSAYNYNDSCRRDEENRTAVGEPEGRTCPCF